MSNKQHLFDEALEFVKGNQVATDVLIEMRRAYSEAPDDFKRHALYYFMTGFSLANQLLRQDLSDWLTDFALAE